MLSLGDTYTAMVVCEPTIDCIYIVTPNMLRGKEPIEFSGSGSSRSSTATTSDDEVLEEDITIKEYDEPSSGN